MVEGEEGGYQIAKKMMFYVLFLLIMGTLLVGMIYIFRSTMQSPIETSPFTYSDIYLDRLLNSPDCLAYKNPETNNAFSMIIDKSKFKNETLNNCFKPIENSRYEFSFLLTDNGKQTYIETENFAVPHKGVSMDILVYDKGQIRKSQLVVGMEGVT